MTTPLGKKLAGTGASPAPKSPLALVLERGTRGQLVELPELGRAWLQLLGAADLETIEAEVTARFKAKGLDQSVELGTLAVGTAVVTELVRALCTLVRAVRDPDARERPFGTLAEWEAVDSDTLVAAWNIYGDVRERLSPLDAPLDPSVRAEILDALAKKKAPALRSFGVSALVTFLVTTEFQPASSPTERSSSGESSPASSP